MTNPLGYSIGPYRDIQTIAIASDDFTFGGGFTVQAGTAGDITYRAINGDEDATVTGLAAGDTITGPGGIPVLCVAVRGSSTVTSIVAGFL